jgi:hypothetical protein
MEMRNIFLLGFILFFAAVQSFAQFGSVGSSDSRSTGMAKTYNSTVRGVYSIGVNPANMIFNQNGSVEFSTVLPFPHITTRTGSSFLSITDFNYYFGGVNGEGRFLDEKDKKNLNDLFSDGGDVYFDLSSSILSVVYKHDPLIGSFGFSVTDFLGGHVTIPQALVNLALTGNPLNKVYSFVDAKINSWWLRNYSLSYARELPEIEQNIFNKIAAGVSLKLYQGFFYIGTERVNTSFSTDLSYAISGNADMLGYSAFSPDFGMSYDFDSTSRNRKNNVGPFPTPAGNGFGFDIGLAATLNKEWSFSFAVTDVGSISWDKEAVEYTALGNIYLDDISSSEQREALEDQIKGEGNYIGSFSTPLPTALRMGAAYLFDDEDDKIPGTLLLAVDYNQGFNSMPGNSVTPRISIGSEWKPMNWIPFIRTGFSFGGIEGFGWAFGLGFNIANTIELDLATSTMHSFVAPNSAKDLSFAIGSRWKL